MLASRLRLAAIAAIVVLAALAAGAAIVAAGSPVPVDVRLQTPERTLFEGTVSVAATDLDGGDGTGPHPCQGPPDGPPRPTATGALDAAARAAGLSWRGLWDPSFGDFFIDRIGEFESQPPDQYWLVFVDEVSVAGGCNAAVESGDRVLWVYDSLSAPSNPLPVCIQAAGECDHPVGEPPPAATAIDKIEPGQRFARGAGPRILRGTYASAASVELALSRLGPGACARWSAARRRLVATRCAAPPDWFAATPAEGAWRARIAALPPGRYELRSRPGVRHGPGGDRVRFKVLRERARAASIASSAERWLGSLQRPDGGLPVATRGPSALAASGWATIALARRGSELALALGRYLARELDPGSPLADLVRTAAALAAAEDSAARRAGGAARGELRARQLADGSFAADANATALAILALGRGNTADRAAARRAAHWLAAQQQTGGGFGYRRGAAPDTDTTGLAAAALAETLRGWDGCRAALGFLRSAQDDDGGIAARPGAPSNSQSTGLAMLGARACGRPARRVRSEDAITPTDYLLTVQRRRGSIAYSASAPAPSTWVTSQAMLGLPRFR